LILIWIIIIFVSIILKIILATDIVIINLLKKKEKKMDLENLEYGESDNDYIDPKYNHPLTLHNGI
jgi:hypothetical protein